MKEYTFYFTIFLALFISFGCFYQRDYLAVHAKQDIYVLSEAEIAGINRNALLSKTEVHYYVGTKLYCDEVCYCSTDKIGDIINVYYNIESLDAKREGFVKDINIYLILSIIAFIVMCMFVIVGGFSKIGFRYNSILLISVVFDIYLFFATYAALEKDEDWRLWLMIMVWGIGMVTLGVISKKDPKLKIGQ